ncbi:MAG: translocation/assembly module TamB domain-containing protein [Myxococcales bacterium]|nr:translocation/assembly module TamB domain-containing protein [Myxococcales bacterium]
MHKTEPPPPTVPDTVEAVPRRRVRVLGFLGRSFGLLALLAVFATSLGAGAILHVNLPASRRVASTLLSRSLSGVFYGEVKTGQIEDLGLRGATLSDVIVKDEAGSVVLTLNDVRVRADVIPIVREVLTAKERVTLIIRNIRADRADVQVVPDEQGIPTLARALTPIESAPKTPTAPKSASRPLRVWLPQIELGKVYARGTVAGLPILEVGLGGVRGSVLATPKGAAIDVHRYGMTVRGLAGTDATGTGELHIRAPGAVWSSFNGYFGNLPLAGSVYVKGPRVAATVDIPRALPEDVRALLSDWPLTQTVSAHVEATGTLPELQTNARFEIEDTRLTASGPIRFAPAFRVDLDVEGRGVDIRAIWPQAPKSKVDVDTSVAVWDRLGQIVVDVNGTTGASTFSGQLVPPMDVNGTWNEKGFEGKATLHETGMPLKVAFTVHPSGALDLEARARSFQIERAPRVRQLTPAKGRVEAVVKAHIEKNQLDSTLIGDVAAFSLGDVQLAHGHLTGRARGPLTDLDKINISAKVVGKELVASGQSFARVDVEAKGPVRRPALTAHLRDDYGPEVTASATLDARGKPSIKNLDLQVKRDGATLGGRISTLNLDTRDVVVNDLKLSGAGGELTGRARISKERVELKAKGEGLDLDVVSRALGLPRGLLGGRLNVDTDIIASKGESHGHVRIALGKGSIASVGGVSLSVNATLDGEHIEGNASGVVEDVGGFGATWQSELDGNPADPKSWLGMTGDGEIQLSELQLSLLQRVLPESAHIEKIAGTAFARLRVERLGPQQLPNVRVEIAGTRKLAIVRAPEKKGDKPTELTGVELQMAGGVNGDKGDASGTTQLYDAAGALITTSGTARIDWKKILEDPSDWLSQLLEAPVMAMFTLHERPFALLPEPVRPTAITGSAGARVIVSGSVSDPKLSANFEAHSVQATGSARALPVDLRAAGLYELASGRFAASVDAFVEKHRVAQFMASGNASIVDGSWTGGAHWALEGVPLGVVPALAEAKVNGNLRGSIAVQRQTREEPPQLSAKVDVSSASVDGVSVGRGTILVRSDGRQLRAQAEFDDGQGQLSAEARFGLDWSGALPDLDRERRVLLSAESRGYDAVVVSPFVRDVFSRLTGKVDGKLSLVLEAQRDAKGKPTKEFDVTVDGKAKLKSGVLNIAPLGIEFRDLTCDATARTSGRYSIVEIRDVLARSRSETPNVRALANLYFERLRLARGNASLSMTEVPLLFNGVSQATATGFSTIGIEREDERMVVTVNIPSLTAKLPQASGREVVELADNPAIEVVQALREPRTPSTEPLLPWRFVVNLQRGVRITRADLNLPLIGQPVIDLGKDTTVGGFIELEPGGRFQSWGKTWVIDAGRVVFDTPEPSDPHLFATASWRAPDGTVVFVDVRGTLRDAKLKLTSDPARSEPEIMALLFGGSSSGASDESSGARTRETAAAGGIATAFNTLFADALVGSVELRTGTDENKASYTAAVRLSESVWFEGTYRNRLEQQQDATNTEPVDVSGTVDWRFQRNWSLRTEVGTVGTGLDLLWQYRY